VNKSRCQTAVFSAETSVQAPLSAWPEPPNLGNYSVQSEGSWAKLWLKASFDWFIIIIIMK
jgi:hypothetical protein